VPLELTFEGARPTPGAASGSALGQAELDGGFGADLNQALETAASSSQEGDDRDRRRASSSSALAEKPIRDAAQGSAAPPSKVSSSGTDRVTPFDREVTLDHVAPVAGVAYRPALIAHRRIGLGVEESRPTGGGRRAARRGCRCPWKIERSGYWLVASMRKGTKTTPRWTTLRQWHRLGSEGKGCTS